jgi:hypothetical protein
MASGFFKIKETALKEALIDAGGNVSLASRRLDISRAAANNIIDKSPRLQKLLVDLKSSSMDSDIDDDIDED